MKSKSPFAAAKTYIAASNGEELKGNSKFNFQRVRASGTIDRSSEPLISNHGNGDGDINASNKKELMQAIGQLITAASSGAVKEAPKAAAEVRDRKMALASAFADKSGQAWQALGEVIGDEVVETLGREGFSRKLLQFKPLSQGERNQVRIRTRDTLGFVATSDPRVVPSVVRQNVVYPPNFYLIANILIEEMEIQMDTGDLLDDRYQDGLEQIMVQEDKIFKTLADTAASALNDRFFFTSFTPTVFQSMKTTIASHGGIPVANMLISYDIWNDIVAEPEFTAWYSEIAKHELVMEGNLGSLGGTNIITDGYRIPTLKVLNQGQVYFFGIPETLGQIGQLGELTVKPVDKANDGKPMRGWFMNQIESMVIANAKACVRGDRL